MARIDFNYTSKDDIGAVQSYPVSLREVAVDRELDAMVLQVLDGDANADLGGHIPMKMMSAVEPFQELRMIHHPGGTPQQYSSVTCQVHRRQAEIPDARSPFRHTCESIGGSSGSLLLDSRTLSVVGLHNQGGLEPTGDSFNSGHKIGKIEAALNLGFEEFELQKNTSDDARRALTDALMQFDPVLKMQALRNFISSSPGTSEAKDAKRALEQLTGSNNAVFQLAAGQALSDALLQSDPGARLSALRKIMVNYASSQTAEKAQSAIERLEANLALQKRDTEAKNRLKRAQTDGDVAAMKALLSEFAGTPFEFQVQLVLLETTNSGNFRDRALIRKCDELTAHEYNPDNPFGVEPVDYSSINADLAIPACEAALKAFPDDLRMQHQLGRAYQADVQHELSVALWSKAAAAGYAAAQLSLGLAYDNGVGVNQDSEAALQLYRQAAEYGHSSAQTNLGYEYIYGMKKDRQAAAYWFELAAAQGNFEALLELFLLAAPNADSVYVPTQLENGEFEEYNVIVSRDCNAIGLRYFHQSWDSADQTVATLFFLRACRGNDTDGCYNAGLQFYHRRGVEEDQSWWATVLLTRACNGGHADGCYMAARQYHSGAGVVEDQTRALQLYIMACDGNSSSGCNGAAYSYLHGRGVAADEARSKQFYAKSCSLGDDAVCSFQ